MKCIVMFSIQLIVENSVEKYTHRYAVHPMRNVHGLLCLVHSDYGTVVCRTVFMHWYLSSHSITVPDQHFPRQLVLSYALMERKGRCMWFFFNVGCAAKICIAVVMSYVNKNAWGGNNKMPELS